MLSHYFVQMYLFSYSIILLLRFWFEGRLRQGGDDQALVRVSRHARRGEEVLPAARLPGRDERPPLPDTHRQGRAPGDARRIRLSAEAARRRRKVLSAHKHVDAAAVADQEAPLCRLGRHRQVALHHRRLRHQGTPQVCRAARLVRGESAVAECLAALVSSSSARRMRPWQ